MILAFCQRCGSTLDKVDLQQVSIHVHVNVCVYLDGGVRVVFVGGVQRELDLEDQIGRAHV